MTPRSLTQEEVAEIVALRKRRSLPADLAESFDRLIHTLRQREAEIGRLREVVEAAKEVAPYGKHHCWFAPDGLCKTCSLRVPLAALNPPPREEGQHGNG